MPVLKTKKSKVVVATAAILALSGGAAFAYWTSDGAGTGTGTTGTSTAFTVVTNAVTDAGLTPGTSQSVPFTVTNPGTGAQFLTGVVVTVANAGGVAWTAVPGCSSLDYTVGTVTITAGQIAAGATKTGSVMVTMNNLASSQDACKNVAYPLYFVTS